MTYTYEEVMAKRKELILEIKTLTEVIDGSKEKLKEAFEAVKAIDKANELFGIQPEEEEEELYRLELGIDEHKKNTLSDLCISVLRDSDFPLLSREVKGIVGDKGYRKTKHFDGSIRETLRRLSVAGIVTKTRGSRGMYVYSVNKGE